MTLTNFLIKDKNSQLNIIKEQGALLGERLENNGRFYLFAVEDFYVELFYQKNVMAQQEIILTKVFDSLEYLEPYLTAIDISELYSG